MSRLRRVDAVNTFRVFPGRFTYFRVVSRRQIRRLRSSGELMCRVRFPAAPPIKVLVRSTFSGPGLFHKHPRRQYRPPLWHPAARLPQRRHPSTRKCCTGSTASKRQPRSTFRRTPSSSGGWLSSSAPFSALEVIVLTDAAARHFTSLVPPPSTVSEEQMTGCNNCGEHHDVSVRRP